MWHTAGPDIGTVFILKVVPKTPLGTFTKPGGAVSASSRNGAGLCLLVQLAPRLLEWGIDFVKVDGQSAVFNFFGGGFVNRGFAVPSMQVLKRRWE